MEFDWDWARVKGGKGWGASELLGWVRLGRGRRPRRARGRMRRRDRSQRTTSDARTETMPPHHNDPVCPSLRSVSENGGVILYETFLGRAGTGEGALDGCGED